MVKSKLFKYFSYIFYVIFYTIAIFSALHFIFIGKKDSKHNRFENNLKEFIRSDFNYITRVMRPKSHRLEFTHFKSFDLTINPNDYLDLSYKIMAKSVKKYPCTFKIGLDKKATPCVFKIHTTTPWHWNTIQKSLDIELENSSNLYSLDKFTLLKPKSPFFPLKKIFSDYARKYEIISPQHEIILGHINGEYIGPYILKENINEDYLKNSFPPGFVANHDMKNIRKHNQLKDFFKNPIPNRKEIELYQSEKLWQLTAAHPTDLFNKNPVEYILRAKKKSLEEQYDLVYMARLMALTMIFNHGHFTPFFNNLVYFNHMDEKMYPIPIDTSGTSYSTLEVPGSRTELWKDLLKIRKFEVLYYSYLNKMVNEDHIFQTVRDDILFYIKNLKTPIRNAKVFELFHTSLMGVFYQQIGLYSAPHSPTYARNYEDFANEGYLNLANLLYREKMINDLLIRNTEKIKNIPESKKSNWDLNCQITGPINDIGILIKQCPHINISKDKKKIFFDNIKDLSISNLKLKGVAIYINNIKRLTLSSILLENNSSLTINKVFHASIEGLRIENSFGTGLSLSNILEVELMTINFSRILTSPIRCLNSHLKKMVGIEVDKSYHIGLFNKCTSKPFTVKAKNIAPTESSRFINLDNDFYRVIL